MLSVVSRKDLRGRVGDVDVTVTGHFAAPSRNAETSFGTGFPFAPAGGDPDVRIDLERLSGLVETLYRDDAAGYSHLWSGDADTVLLRRGHGCHHLVSKGLIFMAF